MQNIQPSIVQWFKYTPSVSKVVVLNQGTLPPGGVKNLHMRREQDLVA